MNQASKPGGPSQEKKQRFFLWEAPGRRVWAGSGLRGWQVPVLGGVVLCVLWQIGPNQPNTGLVAAPVLLRPTSHGTRNQRSCTSGSPCLAQHRQSQPTHARGRQASPLPGAQQPACRTLGAFPANAARAGTSTRQTSLAVPGTEGMRRGRSCKAPSDSSYSLV